MNPMIGSLSIGKKLIPKHYGFEMKISRKYNSPNFEVRKGNLFPNKVIIHYTGMKSTKSAFQRLCSQQSKVSSHYLINRDGKIWQLVDEEMSSWHAGESSWLNEKNLNDSSIGVELCNPGHEFGYKNFSEKQMLSLEWLLKRIMDKYKITPESILGHSDVSPARKKDPGEKFKWERLAKKGLSIWPTEIEELPKVYDKQALIYKSLESIGYDVKNHVEESIIAFKRHFIPFALKSFLLEGELKILTSVANYYNKIRIIS